MKRAFVASSIGVWLCVGCGAAGGDDSGPVSVRQNQPPPDSAGPGQVTDTSTDPGAPTTGVGGPTFVDAFSTTFPCPQTYRIVGYFRPDFSRGRYRFAVTTYGMS